MSSDDDKISEGTTSSSDSTTSETTGTTITDTNTSSPGDTSDTSSTDTDTSTSDDDSDSGKQDLTNEDLNIGRHIRVEDSHWGLSTVPSLKDIVIAGCVKNVKGSELKSLMDNATAEQKKKILDILPLDIPLKYTLACLGTGKYWERQCLEKWPPSSIWRYGDDWKTMFVELTVETYIGNFVPGMGDIEQLKEFLSSFKEYNHRLRITRLKKRNEDSLKVDLESENFDDVLDDYLARSEFPSMLLDFETVFECLSEIKDLSLSSTPLCVESDSFNLSIADFNSLLRGLKKLPKLGKFRCSNGTFSNEQITIFICLFIDFKFLHELNLSCNLIDDKTCDYIGRLLMSSCPLETLILKHNRISDDGAVSLATGLSMNLKLKKLDLSMNYIEDTGVKFISEVLAKSSVLEHLDVSRNKFRVRGGMALADMLLFSKSIRSLDISKNNIGKECGRKLKESIQANKNILNLNINFCNLSPDDEDAIHQALKSNLSVVNYGDYTKDQRNRAAALFVL
ncbi:hypothetical protein JTE90_025068 [Oedothorax gibbosus]|uniref:Uncharacterized protein n=1 Tax=Oedothorax gibbosus TaxID=931172 RepID=A0AAV6U7Z6_9ARAC|nr:hypothetical protein JTE90_025068 [Oedothorax gibbosus]